VIASTLGSRLDSVVTLLDEKGRQLASNDDFDGRRDSLLAYSFRQRVNTLFRSLIAAQGSNGGPAGSGPSATGSMQASSHM
jgi:hypothetical protein